MGFPVGVAHEVIDGLLGQIQCLEQRQQRGSQVTGLTHTVATIENVVLNEHVVFTSLDGLFKSR